MLNFPIHSIGFFAAWLWPADSSFYLNIFPALLGDQIYNLSIRYFGDTISPQAHYTIPWILRIPQVYVITSIVVYGLIGLLVQLAYNRRSEVKGGDEIPSYVLSDGCSSRAVARTSQKCICTTDKAI